MTTGGFCGLKPLLLGCRPSRFEHLIKIAHLPKYPKKEGKGPKMERSRRFTGNFILMMELRKKIFNFRDAIDLPPCDGTESINELVSRTMKDLHKFHPDIISRSHLSEIKGASIHKVLICCCEALRLFGDSLMKNQEWMDKVTSDKFSNIEKLNSEKLVELALAMLECVINMAKEKSDIIDEDEQIKDSLPAAAFKKILMEFSESNTSCCVSPVTPTSVLTTQFMGSPISDEFANISCSSSVLRSLRVQAVGKLNPIDLKRLSFQITPNIGAQGYSTWNLKNDETMEEIEADRKSIEADRKSLNRRSNADEELMFEMEASSNSEATEISKVDDAGDCRAKNGSPEIEMAETTETSEAGELITPTPPATPLLIPPMSPAIVGESLPPPMLQPNVVAPPLPPPPPPPPFVVQINKAQQPPPTPPLPPPMLQPNKATAEAPLPPPASPMSQPKIAAPAPAGASKALPPSPPTTSGTVTVTAALPLSPPPPPPSPMTSGTAAAAALPLSPPPPPPSPMTSGTAAAAALPLSPPPPPPSPMTSGTAAAAALPLSPPPPPPSPMTSGTAAAAALPLSPPPQPPSPMTSGTAAAAAALPLSPPPSPMTSGTETANAALPLSPPPPPKISGTATAAPPPPPPPMSSSNGSMPVPPPTPMAQAKGGAPPPPPPGAARSLRPKKAQTKLRRSSQMGNLYRILKGKVEGGNQNLKSANGKKSSSQSSNGGKQGMADALAEMTKRSAYFQQIEEDVQKYAKSVSELKTAIIPFKNKDMDELIKFHAYVESILEKLTDETQVLARFEGFPQKKLEALRIAAALYIKLSGILHELQNWKIVTPLGQLLDKTERYFNKIKREIDALERTKDEESKKFQGQNIQFDFHILVQIKEAMVDVSSNCMELVLKERKATDSKANSNMLWGAFQFAFKVYSFAGGQDDRADKLTRDLAHEIETDSQNQ